MKILILDHIDSFTYNIYHYLEQLTDNEINVVRYSGMTIKEVENYDKILLSPGPGLPSEYPDLIPIIQKYSKTKSILGVCLGMQAIVEAFGGDLINGEKVQHGQACTINIIDDKTILYQYLPKEIQVARYHSWLANKIPDCLTITSKTNQDEVMSVRHNTLDVRGVQYHPESILTPKGLQILKNWLQH